MQAQIDQYTAEINALSPANADELEIFRIKFLGTKGIIKDLFEQFKTVGPEEKRTFGKVLNEFKQLAEAKYNELKENLNSEIESPIRQLADEIDLTLPGDGFNLGSRHPLSMVRLEIIDIFKRLGFVVAEGPEIEDDWHNMANHRSGLLCQAGFTETKPYQRGHIAFFTRLKAYISMKMYLLPI